MVKRCLRGQSTILLYLLILVGGCSGPPVKSDTREAVIYPSPPAIPRIQYLTSFSNSTEFCGPQSSFRTFIFGEEKQLPIIKPYGITVHGNKIYICDTGLGGLEILDLQDKTFAYFTPTGLGQLQFPVQCDLDENDYLYIADGNRKQIVIFDQDRMYYSAITIQDEGKPTDVEVDNDFIWVSVVDDHSIHKYDRTTLEFIGKIPGDVDNPSIELFQPANLSISDSCLYISDIGACSASVLDKNDELRVKFGSPGRGFGQFTRPKGIDNDHDGNIYVVDAAFENVQLFNNDGTLLMYFGGSYKKPGDMWLPAAVCVSYENLEYFREFVMDGYILKYLVFVTNQFGPDKISVYGFIGP